jgi:Nidogen-like
VWVNNNGNVTFDAPLWTYTPFELQAPTHAIIAPYFADVDTRGSGSAVVRYGWGTTTFEGRPAFCVNCVDVGYYNSHFDKLNSFQLLLVDRSDVRGGDFDIVFNYGTVNWETGDASGGSGGFGGESARVGFANGDGSAVNSYELPGSGIDGSLLDSNPVRGLIHNSIGSSQDGRYIYRIRNGQPAPDEYVAMGDSYQSGEGPATMRRAPTSAGSTCATARRTRIRAGSSIAAASPTSSTSLPARARGCRT